MVAGGGERGQIQLVRRDRLIMVLTLGGCTSVALACGSTATGAMSATDAGDDGARVPDGCAGVDNAHQSETCLSALRTLCRAHTTEAECAAEEPIAAYDVVCTWARVVTFSDPASCAPTSDEGRCEGTSTFPQDGPFCGAWYAFPDERELVKVNSCAGPIGPWSTIGIVHNVGVCLPNVTPPPPAICACADNAAPTER
jgi:hypothetical protein